jgi:hypothetical protein
MTAKKADCVEMMHRGAERVRAKIKGMTKKQEVAFWQQRSEELRRRQNAKRAQSKNEPSSP